MQEQEISVNAPNASKIRFATFLSALLYRTYEQIASYVQEQVGYPTSLTVGRSLAQFEEGQVDVAFICGLPYIHMTNGTCCPVELLAAPVLLGPRYGHTPIYFSDVIVRNDSPYATFDDLHGCAWAYNERASHSGYNLVCYSLLERGKSTDYLGKTVKSGSHLRSLEMVLEGKADATAIDSHVLDVLLSRCEELNGKLRIIDTFGPSHIPPVVVAKSLTNELKGRVQEALLTMHRHCNGASILHEGLIERFVPVTDDDYSDIRQMLIRVEGMDLPFE